jgi:FeoC like transcriptional regulator
MNATAASPMRAVLAEFQGGSTSLAQVAAHTGLDLDLVRSIVDQLVRMRLVSSQPLVAGCPGDGCGGCANVAADGSPCGSGRETGPVMLRLITRSAD